MSVADLIRDLQELAETYGKHTAVVIPSITKTPWHQVVLSESPVDEAKYEQGKIHIR